MAKKSSNLFAKLELDYADHPKIMGLSDAAFRLHVTMILYSRKYETDGLIKNPVGLRLANQFGFDAFSELENNDENSPSVQKLPNGDWLLHGFTDIQESKADISARTRRNSENGKLGGRPKKTQSVTESVSDLQSESGTQKKAETETETETELKDKPKVADAPVRQEILELLDYLDNCIQANGARKPNRTKKNIDSMRLLIDNDKHSVDEVRGAIDWATSNSFWKSHILSAAKLREKFDTMRLQATTVRSNGSEQRLRQGADLVARTAARGHGAFDYDPFEGKAIEQ